MKAYTKRVLIAGTLAGAVLEHELSGHGVPHVEIPEPGEPFRVVSQQNILASGENLAVSPLSPHGFRTADVTIRPSASVRIGSGVVVDVE